MAAICAANFVDLQQCCQGIHTPFTLFHTFSPWFPLLFPTYCTQRSVATRFAKGKLALSQCNGAIGAKRHRLRALKHFQFFTFVTFSPFHFFIFPCMWKPAISSIWWFIKVSWEPPLCGLFDILKRWKRSAILRPDRFLPHQNAEARSKSFCDGAGNVLKRFLRSAIRQMTFSYLFYNTRLHTEIQCRSHV